MKEINKCYCYCPVCNASPKVTDFKSIAVSLSEAKAIIEQHEKEFHNGKPVGIFGTGIDYPEDFKMKG